MDRDPAQLPSGRHGLSREFVLQNQRDRIMAGVMRAVSDLGYTRTTVGDIVTMARLSRRTFYEHFEGKDDCFLAAYDAAVAQVVERVGAAYRAEDDWGDRVAAALGTFVEMIVADPDLGQVCLSEVVAAGPAALERRDEAMKMFARAIHVLGSRQAPDGIEVPPLAAELVVGGIYEIVTARFSQGRPEALYDEIPQLVYCVVVPFCGHAEAEAVAQRVALRRGNGGSGAGDSGTAPAAS